jgi:hypothetical protein
MRQHTTPIDRHPVSIFGQQVCDRLFSTSRAWGWRQVAWPMLATCSALSFGMAWFSFRTNEGDLHILSWLALAALFAGGARQVWSDHVGITIGVLLSKAKTSSHRRWLERLDAYQQKLLKMDAAEFVLVGPDGTNSGLTDGKLSALLHGKAGRLRIIGSGYSDEERLALHVPSERILVRVEVKSERTEDDQGTPEAASDGEPDSGDTQLDCVQVLHGVEHPDFKSWRNDLVNKARGKTKNRLTSALNAIYEVANDKNRNRAANVIDQIFNRLGEGDHYSRETIDKILHGTKSSKRYAYILPYLIARGKGELVRVEPAEKGHPKVHFGQSEVTP